MKRRTHRRRTALVMLRWSRGEFDMPLHEWARRFLTDPSTSQDTP